MDTVNPKVTESHINLLEIYRLIDTSTIGHFIDFVYAKGIKYMADTYTQRRSCSDYQNTLLKG